MLKSLGKFIKKGKLEDTKSRAITFSNLVFTSLPIVYLIFFIIDIQIYFIPLADLKWDQFVVPVFILLFPVFFYFNNHGYSLITRVVFLIIWPIVLHIIPIIILSTPLDYYLAFPFGIVFHAVLIQFMISRRDESVLFYIMLALNFAGLIYFPDFLAANNSEPTEGIVALSSSRYYLLDAILYWLLFNILIGYIFEVVSLNIYRLNKDKEVIAFKNAKIQETLNQLSTTQNQLVQSEKMASLGVLVGGFAHEINNPVNVIGGNLDLLHKYLDSNEEADIEEIKLLINNAIGGSNRLKQVTGNMQMLSTGNEKTVKTSVKDIILNALKLSRIQYIENLSLEQALEEKMIECYPAKLHRVVIALFDNARYELQKHPLNPYLFISLNFEEDYFKIIIANNGAHIPEESINKIFDPFFTDKEPGEGLGLGLYISYQIVKEQQGNIEVENTSDLVKFKIEIPFPAKKENTQDLNNTSNHQPG